MQVNGRDLNGKHPLSEHGGVEVKTYERIPGILVVQRVQAAMATDFGALVVGQQGIGPVGPDEPGNIVPFTPGDYICCDIPATRAWVEKGIVFEAAYKEV